ncbi:hypothetical protein G4V62_13765 [Bacillaceae bacterium SIJ1]|uniref:hypothetical protein n=1 Tax=Litoribacterium kuwaitense TaxID=1398745 RepID=UPI0013EE0F32|nr:hypothetical protein [Litoribacterium kuwaitense]NGP45961.1 hypothetical protein [Litoribacterium kuwaitense]
MIHTSVICKIEKYEESTGIADLEPLFLDENGSPLPKVINARAQRQRFKMPKKIVLEGGSVNHSPIPDMGTSHTINNGDITVSYEDSQTEDVILFPFYEKGDIVLVSIPDYDLSDAIKGRKGNGDSKEPHGLTSAIITGLVGDMT